MTRVWQSFERQVMICREAEVKKFVGVALSAIAIVGLSSCGDDNPSGSEVIAQAMMEIGGEQGFEVDEDCLNEILSGLISDDVKILTENLDAVLNGTVELLEIGVSGEGIALIDRTRECVKDFDERPTSEGSADTTTP
jgi:hypothetical protein